MKKILNIFLIFTCLICLSGAKRPVESPSGYVGKLPDINSFEDLRPSPDSEEAQKYDIDAIPLDKLIVPVDMRTSDVEDLEYKKYLNEVDDILNSFEKIRTGIEKNCSVQYYASVANVLNLKIQNFKEKNKSKKKYESYKLISDVNDDIQSFKTFWLYADKNREYVSNYKTGGKYSEETVNDVKQQLLNILNYSIPVIRKSEI